MKELGTKHSFSKSLKKSTISRGKRERGFITGDLNKKATNFFFPATHITIKIMPCVSECNYKWDRNKLCLGTDTVLFSAVSKQQHPEYPYPILLGKEETQ